MFAVVTRALSCWRANERCVNFWIVAGTRRRIVRRPWAEVLKVAKLCGHRRLLTDNRIPRASEDAGMMRTKKVAR